MTYVASVMKIATVAPTKVEKKRMSAKRISSFRKIPSTATKKIVSGLFPEKKRRRRSSKSSRSTTSKRTRENPKNFQRIIFPRAIGLERRRYIVRPSISRAIIPPASKRTIENPESSIKESQKSNSTRRVSPRESVSSTREKSTKKIPRKISNEKNRLRMISRKVFLARVNIL